MEKTHILIVEDETDIQQLVSYTLLREGFHVSCAENGEEALTLSEKKEFDCILLDLMLPGIDGFQVCTELRKGDTPPIIMMTARGEEEDIITGLENGADDYITKPFSPKVLVARIRALLRRNQKSPLPEKSDKIIIDTLEINSSHHQVKLDEKILQLTPTEFSILQLLAQKPGWVFSRQQIIDSVHGYDFLVTTRAVDVQIFGLRKKLGLHGKLIETVRGIGYKFSTTN